MIPNFSCYFTEDFIPVCRLLKLETVHAFGYIKKFLLDLILPGQVFSGIVIEKRTFDGIPYLMTQVAQKELAKLNDSITKCSVTYLPQVSQFSLLACYVRPM